MLSEACATGKPVTMFDLGGMRDIEDESQRDFRLGGALYALLLRWFWLRLRAVQTAQCRHADLLRKAFEQPYDATFTDEAALVERLGVKVELVEGEEKNIKVTTAEDLRLTEVLIAGRE